MKQTQKRSTLITQHFEQGVAITGRNTTEPPCRVGRPTVHAPGRRSARPLAAFPHSRPVRPPAAVQTTTDDSQQNNTGPLGRPVITLTTISQMLLLSIIHKPAHCLYHKCNGKNKTAKLWA